MRFSPDRRGPGSCCRHQDGQGQASAVAGAATGGAAFPGTGLAAARRLTTDGRGDRARRPLRCGHRPGARPRADGCGRRQPARGHGGGGRRPAHRCPGAARPDHGPRRPQAGRLVSLPWRIWHGIGDSRLSRCQPGLARARTARRSAPRRRCSTARPARRRSGPSSPTPSRRRPSVSPRWRAPIWPTRTRRRPKRWRRRPGSISTCRRAWSRPSSSALAPCSRRPTTSAASTACCSTTAAGPASATSARPSSAA